MDMTEYQNMAMTTLNSRLGVEQVVLMCTLGLSGEAGEVADIVKKVAFHAMREGFTDNELERLKSELGDVLWYVAGLSFALGLNLEDVANSNIRKLTERHKKGFAPRYDSDSGVSI